MTSRWAVIPVRRQPAASAKEACGGLWTAKRAGKETYSARAPQPVGREWLAGIMAMILSPLRKRVLAVDVVVDSDSTA